MEIPGLTSATAPGGVGATPTLSLVRGDLTRLPVGELLSATLVQPLPGNQAQIRTAGTELTVRVPFPVSPESALLLRAVPPVVPNGKPALQFLGEVFPRPQNPSINVPTPTQPNVTLSVPTIPGQPAPTQTTSVQVPVAAPQPNVRNEANPKAPTRSIPPNFIPATVRQDPAGNLQLEVGKTLIPVRSENLQPGQQVLIRLPGPGPRTPFLPTSGSRSDPVSDDAEAPAPRGETTTLAGRSVPVTTDRVVVSRLLDVAQGILPRGEAPPQPALVLAEGLQPPTSNGQQIVQIASREVPVQTETPIPVGSRVIVQLESTPQGIQLKTVSPNELPPTRVAEAILNALPQRPAVGATLQTLQQSLNVLPNTPETPELQQLKTQLQNLLPAKGEAPTAEQVARFVREGGLQYEARLARLPEDAPRETVRDVANSDLKAQLLRLVNPQPGKPTESSTQPIPAAKLALDAIEIQQTLNSLAQTTQGTFQFHIPLAGPAQWLTMQLAVQPDAGSSEGQKFEGGSRGFNLMMHLELEDLGDTWIDARVNGKNLSAVLYLESESGRDLARAEAGELKTVLRQAGFESILLDVRATSDLPTGRGGNSFEALKEAVPINPSQVDERA